MITHDGIEYITYEDLRPGCITFGKCTLLAKAEHNRDLMRRGVDGFSFSAGRLEDGQDVPFGTELVSNHRGYLWWGSYADNPGVYLICCSEPMRKEDVKFP
jgi:hypothetical protein